LTGAFAKTTQLLPPSAINLCIKGRITPGFIIKIRAKNNKTNETLKMKTSGPNQDAGQYLARKLILP